MLQEIKEYMDPFDGIAKIWWVDIDSLLRTMDTGAWQHVQKLFFEDKGKYSDLPHDCSYRCTKEQIT